MKMKSPIYMSLLVLSTFLSDAISDTPSKFTTATTQPAKVALSTAVTPKPAPVLLDEILSCYLHMKDAFAVDNDKEASVAANKLVKAFANFNKSILNTEQKKLYKDIEDDFSKQWHIWFQS